MQTGDGPAASPVAPATVDSAREHRQSMARSVRNRPDYPFADLNLEGTVREVGLFLADPPLSPIEREEVLEFVRLVRQYAFLERLVQGEILFDLPVHLGAFDRGTAPHEGQAEAAAEEERELLELGPSPAERLHEVLEERGIKVLRRTRGTELPGRLTGGFHYAGDSGPGLLIGAAQGSPEASFVLAHEYGHLLMDVDPYERRFCRWNRRDLSNPNDAIEERRADRFARALLLPVASIREFGSELGLHEALDVPNEEMLQRAAQMFDVAPAVLWRRLEDLDLPAPLEAPEPAETEPARKPDERRPTDLPERFVNLALAAFSLRMLERPDLGRFLRIAPERLDRFLAWCPVPREPKPAGEERGQEESGPPPETGEEEPE